MGRAGNITSEGQVTVQVKDMQCYKWRTGNIASEGQVTLQVKDR